MPDILVRRLHALMIVGCEQARPASPLRMAASFQAMFSASCTPEFPPRAPNGET